MSGFTAVDLSQLPAPDVTEALSFEIIFAAMLVDLQSRDNTFDALLESDPAYKILEVAAYRELLIRQRTNEASLATMLAFAEKADLDQIGGTFSVTRLVLDPGDANAVPPVPPTYESDDDFRYRIQLSPEGYSVAGPKGAYVFHALSADGDVLDARPASPTPGDVVVSVLSRTGDGTAAQALLDAVNTALSDETVRPLTDNVSVQSATISPYSIAATLYFYSGPGSAQALAAAQSAIEKYALDQHKLGLDITLSGVYSALHQPGVQRVDLSSPAANIVVDGETATYCTGITLIDGGIDE